MTEKKKKLKDFVFEYPLTEVKIVPETPQEEWKRKTNNLRKWALKNMKETFMILIMYGLWGLIFSYSYSRGGVEALAISLGVALIYKADRVIKVVSDKL
jgi:hypothetical protein